MTIKKMFIFRFSYIYLTIIIRYIKKVKLLFKYNFQVRHIRGRYKKINYVLNLNFLIVIFKQSAFTFRPVQVESSIN